jgi:eukaryotic-like serine/threonine-protein kinase
MMLIFSDGNNPCMTVIQSLSGHYIGQYQIQELIGKGGMSAVYHAYQPSLERHVAIKVLSRSLVNEPTYLTRFMQEAKTAASLEHPHIVPIYDYGTHGDISYIVMRLLSGGTLAQRLDYRMYRGDSLPSLGEVSVLLRQLGSALDYAHAHGVIHRDIKTGNVMFDRRGTAYLVDFGIAKLIHSSAALTTDGSLLGTPSYMSPEQWESQTLTPAADQYALAVLIYLLVAGQTPYSGSNYLELMRQHIGASLPSISNIPTPAINHVLSRALAKSPQQRFPTVGAFADAFAQAVRDWEGESTDFSTFVLPSEAILTSLPAVNVGTIPPTPLLTPSLPPLPSHTRRTYVMLGIFGIVVALLLLIGLVLSAYMLIDIFFNQPTADPITTSVDIIQLPTHASTLTPIPPTSTVEATPRRQMAVLPMTQIGLLSAGSTPIRSIAFNPDGSFIASSGGDGMVNILDVDTQSQQTSLPGGEDVIYSLAFSPDGKLLAAGCGDGFVRLWNVATGELIRTLSHDQNEIRSIAFDLTGERLASAGLDRTIHIWDVASGFQQAELKGHSDRILSIAFSPDGSKLGSGSQDRSVIIWDIGTQAPIATLNGHLEEVRDVAFSPDGSTIASSSSDDTIKLWEANTGHLIMTLEDTGQDIFSVTFSPDGQFVVSGDRGNTIHIWDSQTGTNEGVLQGHEGWVFDLAFSQVGSILASAGGDGTIRFWGGQ